MLWEYLELTLFFYPLPPPRPHKTDLHNAIYLWHIQQRALEYDPSLTHVCSGSINTIRVVQNWGHGNITDLIIGVFNYQTVEGENIDRRYTQWRWYRECHLCLAHMGEGSWITWSIIEVTEWGVVAILKLYRIESGSNIEDLRTGIFNH